MAVRKLDIEKEAKMVVEAKIFSFTNWFSIYKRSLSVRRTDHAMRHDVIQYLLKQRNKDNPCRVSSQSTTCTPTPTPQTKALVLD